MHTQRMCINGRIGHLRVNEMQTRDNVFGVVEKRWLLLLSS